MKKKMIMLCVLAMVVLVVLTAYMKRDAIFQRGNPVPYLIAVSQISEDNPFVEVDDSVGIYISKRGKCPELFAYFQDQLNAEFVEQAGSGYVFTDGTENYVISSEIYWGNYTVWTLPLS